MTDEILRNGVPHNVTTSLVTRNAVLPQNIFMKEASPVLRDSEMEAVMPSLVTKDPTPEVDRASSKLSPQAPPNYPVTQDKLTTNDALTTIKSHIRDNIQALKNLAHSDNIQSVGGEEFNKNMQSLGDSRSIENNKLYLEKKSIKSNRQFISQNTTERPAPNLATPNATSPSGIDSGGFETPANELQNADGSFKGILSNDKDNAFQMRVKKLKGHVRNVDSTLQNLEPDK